MTGKYAFVTVGTTQFDLLIETIVHDKNIIRTLVDCLQIEKLILQIGNSQMPTYKNLPIAIEYYKYKDSIENDIQQADLVISHAGAGNNFANIRSTKTIVSCNQ